MTEQRTTPSAPPPAVGRPWTDPTEAGPLVRLPALRLALASTLGAAIVALPAWAVLARLRPDDMDAIAPGCAVAAGAHLAAMLVERPWRARRLGRWPFAILHASLASMLVVLGAVVLLYSATALEAAPLSLVAAGAWLTGFLSKVFTFGRFAKAAEAGMIPPELDAKDASAKTQQDEGRPDAAPQEQAPDASPHHAGR